MNDNELLALVQSGKEDAKVELLERHMGLIKSILHRFKSSTIDADDLFQVACLGFVKAMNNFDSSLGTKFSTYAFPYIIGEIKRHLRDYRPVRLGRSGSDLVYSIKQAEDHFSNKEGRLPTVTELSTLMGLGIAEIIMALEANRSPASLEMSEEGEPAWKEQLGDSNNNIERKITEMEWIQFLDELPNKQAMVLKLRFLSDRKQKEIAEELNLSQGQVSRLEKQGLQALRKLYVRTE